MRISRFLSVKEAKIDFDSPSGTFWALPSEGRQEALANALTGHFHKTELGDIEDLGTGLVSRERLAERVDHLAAIVFDFHVDEVDNDDAANVSEAKLMSHLLSCLEVVLEDSLFKIGRTDILSRVDVDNRESLGVLDDERAA